MGMMDKIKTNPLPFGVAGVVGIGILAWLAFGFFGIQAAFIDNVVDEEDPFATAAPAAAAEPAEEVAETEPAETADDATQTVADSTAPDAPDASAAAEETTADIPTDDAETVVVEEAPAEEVVEAVEEEAVEVEEAVAAPVEEVVEEPAPVEEVPEEPAVPEVVTLFSGQFQSLPGYEVSGDALVLNDGSERRVLRFENFVSDNGPDLKVYLRADNGEFISLGDLTGNIGDQNYEVPVDVDLSVFRNVEIWCERFNSGFGVATLA